MLLGHSQSGLVGLVQVPPLLSLVLRTGIEKERSTDS